MKHGHSLNIVYMGTPQFAVAPLDAIVRSNHRIKAVITAPDKASGRGLKTSFSDVKQYAISHNLPLLQPTNLKDPQFIESLGLLGADVFVLVAFRMLPREVWQMPPKGTINLHASLLPQYRGAAPINHAIINGDNFTGVSTFFINENIDTGNIIKQCPICIEPDDNAGSLHDKLMHAGSQLVVETLQLIATETVQTIEQNDVQIENLKTAPKIFKEHCLIDWRKPGIEIHNLVRGLSPYPGAFTRLAKNNEAAKICKLLQSHFIEKKHNLPTCSIVSDNKTYIHVAVADGFIAMEHLQMEGKKAMHVSDFLRGFNIQGFNIVNC
ncbi:MAG TPA: methionyl-tRNA formyltransferase [Bacteroidales bacterium]|nr:methionyl-tRNA formyltransferase [Bacteroidales bacterium]